MMLVKLKNLYQNPLVVWQLQQVQKKQLPKVILLSKLL